MALDFALFDADIHYCEPDDCFTRHIEARHRAATVWIDRKHDGPGRMYVADELVGLSPTAVRRILRDNLAGLVA